jgi:hypothetical protein
MEWIFGDLTRSGKEGGREEKKRIRRRRMDGWKGGIA